MIIINYSVDNQMSKLKRGFQNKYLHISVVFCFVFFNTIFVSSHMYPENPEGTQVIVGSMNMGYISDTARNRTHNLFRPKREPIPLGHSVDFHDPLLSYKEQVCKKLSEELLIW